MSIDPLIRAAGISQSANPYSYAENNPTNEIDPTGMNILGWSGSSGRLAGSSGFDDSIDTDAQAVEKGMSEIVASNFGSAGLGGGSASDYAGGGAGSVGTDSAGGAVPAGGSNGANPTSQNRGFWGGAWDFATSTASLLANDMLGAVFGFAFGNVLGMIEGFGTVLGGVLTGNLSMIKDGAGTFGNALVPRFGFNSGPGHGYLSLTPRTVVDWATRIHDQRYARLSSDGVGMFSSRTTSADAQLIRDAWSSHALGPIGQTFRVALTGAFALKIGAQEAIGEIGGD